MKLMCLTEIETGSSNAAFSVKDAICMNMYVRVSQKEFLDVIGYPMESFLYTWATGKSCKVIARLSNI